MRLNRHSVRTYLITSDPQRLAKSLKCLVANALMEKSQALAIYRELNAG